MKFALLGDDVAAVPLIEAAMAAGHRFVHSALATRLIAVHSEFANVPSCSWEELLIDPEVEAIVIAGDSEELQTAAKQLASAGKPLLIVPRVPFGAACAYELSLIRDDSHVELMPAFLLRFAPELVSLSKQLAADELGTIRRFQVDRELPSSSATSALTEAEIDATALDDIDLLQWLGGRYDQVTAQRSGLTEQGCSQATLTLAGSGLPDATWTARRGTAAVWRLTIETDCGPIVLDRPPAVTAPTAMIAAFASSIPHTAITETGERGGVSPPVSSLRNRGADAAPLANRFDLDRSENETPHAPTWSDGVRAFDVLDAARRSLRRRRTIDLHFEILSERQQFKTQMTAIGCGMLMLTLVLMLALLGLGSLLESRDRAVRDAENAGLLLKESDFESQAAVLTPQAETRLARMAERLKEEPKSAYLEPSSNPPNTELDQRRRAKIVEHLANLGVEAADHRTLLAAAVSTGWDTLMRILRLAWIAPLVVFLVLQGLILVAKPTSPRKS